MTGRTVVLEVARLEAAHLSALVAQFADLVDGSTPAHEDPALARLVPTPYPDDDEAAREFRTLTETDLLTRRRADAEIVLFSLAEAAGIPDDPDNPALLEQVEIRLEPETVRAWLRTLAAVRLVMAERLDITRPEDHDPDNPRFGIYDWLGYRLDGLVASFDDGQA
ncbi:DUF2017 family protein [Microbacterium jejuense]|uniref:DUF2017 family protein n=1 Tax=Microbacterium jejuense TaxID=1263637 RepID=UPI0027E26B30|nr:DUF2017 family protein [Microbacterium jejuense]